jgi:hypothetical protein
MTDLFDIEPILDDWFGDGTDYLPDRSIEAVLDTIRHTSQRRRGWPVPWRSSMMQTSLKFAIGAIAVVAIAFGGWFFLRAPASGVGAAPTPSPIATPTPSPTVAPAATPFSSSGFGVPIQLTMPAGWTSEGTEPGSVNLTGPTQPASIMSIAAMTVRGAKSTDSWVPWPADIHAWLAMRAEFRPSEPRSITIGGRPATVIDVDVVTPLADTGDWVKCGPASCGINLRAANDSGAWRIHMVIVPTGTGTGIVAYTDAPRDGFDAAAASLDQLVATLQFR